MQIGWITRNEEGVVTAFCSVPYADRETLKQFALDGTVDLVQAERITLNRPLPEGAIILKSGIGS